MLLLGLVLVSGCESSPTPGIVSEAEAAGIEYLVGIEGMVCDKACPVKIQSALKSIDGVESVTIKYEEKLAVVKTTPNTELTPKICDESFGNSGYFVSKIEKRTPSPS